ncbi:MAG: hypothetical protein RR370_02685 [Synergistaceae bacterium]
MAKIFNFHLNRKLVKLVNEDYIYTCITNVEKEIAKVYWINKENQLEQEDYDLEEVTKNLKEYSWLSIN